MKKLLPYWVALASVISSSAHGGGALRRIRLWLVLGLFFSMGKMGLAQPGFDISPRRELNFSTGWVFIGRDAAGAGERDFDDHAFETVSVPHANVITPHESFDPDMFRFVSWYRKHFQAEESMRGKLVFADFQGVMTVAEVYLNGRLVGRHSGGYTSFSIDLTPALKLGEENVLAVRVDSCEQKQVPPEGADKMFGYYLFGGIQRDVQLRVVDPLHIASVYCTTAAIQPEAEVHVQVSLTNGRPAAATGVLLVRLLAPDGREIASAQSDFSMAAGVAQDLPVPLAHLRGAQLWDVDHPNRCVVMAEVRQDAATIDRHRTWIGIRTIRWDGQTGEFSLNGRPLKLRGMNRHQAFAYVGGAAPNRLQRRDARILKYQMGLNLMRCSHYPPDPQFLDECDRVGLLVMDEFPAWQFIGQSQEWQDNAVQSVREMILRDRNHPSIILWGVRGNEASERAEDDRALYERTYGLARELDPTRPPGGARLSDGWHGKFVPEEVLTVNDYSDLSQWPQPATVKPWLITEYGDAEQFPVWMGERNLLRFTFRWMRFLEGLYTHPEIAGGVGWAAFDYNSPEFDTPVAITAHHCVDDLFRLPKGFTAYALASQADAAVYGPMVKIMSRARRNTREVWVASNAQEVELLANGKSLGRAKPTEYPHVPHPLFHFKLDSFESGELEARAWIGDKLAATDVVRTPGHAKKLQLQADDSTLIADGADMTRVVVSALDEHGTLASREDRRVAIEVANGRFVGENPIHLEGGRIAFYVQTREGRTLPITVHVSAAGLEPAEPLHLEVKLPANSLVPLSDFDSDGLNTLH